mmetsp:Transcript_41175/g.133491  ORF Transcript_41175/g.133491 Transcript_41175/m.133491 type:complete len:212 (-) Transcript_41175:924-1559(-)
MRRDDVVQDGGGSGGLRPARASQRREPAVEAGQHRLQSRVVEAEEVRKGVPRSKLKEPRAKRRGRLRLSRRRLRRHGERRKGRRWRQRRRGGGRGEGEEGAHKGRIATVEQVLPPEQRLVRGAHSRRGKRRPPFSCGRAPPCLRTSLRAASGYPARALLALPAVGAAAAAVCTRVEERALQHGELGRCRRRPRHDGLRASRPKHHSLRAGT